MNTLRLICICIFAAVFATIPASAADSESWSNQTIPDICIVLLPPDWSQFAISSYTGPASGVMDNNDITNVIAIQIFDNANCSAKAEENLEINLDSFNAKAGIANLTSAEFGTDNVTQYGKYNDGKFSNVLLRLFEGSVIAVFGAYDTLEDAKAKAEQFEKIARSVTPVHPASTAFCDAERAKPTPTPTYKPRAVPTVKNTAQPTSVPPA